jgi:glycosyltransferase involved in cell wall biosynthesis
VTTDVPGCRTLVRDGIEGVVVPPNDPAALAQAFARLAANPMLLARMGEAARARVLSGFTERHVMDAVKRLYGSLLAAPA